MLTLGEGFVNQNSCNIAIVQFMAGSRVWHVVNRNKKGARYACTSPQYIAMPKNRVSSTNNGR